jgi:hypothetical protein
MRFAVKDSQIEGDGDEDEKVERKPQERRAHGKRIA